MVSHWSQQPVGRESTNIFVRDLDVVAAQAEDQQRIEVIAEGCPFSTVLNWLLTPLWCPHPRMVNTSNSHDTDGASSEESIRFRSWWMKSPTTSGGLGSEPSLRTLRLRRWGPGFFASVATDELVGIVFDGNCLDSTSNCVASATDVAPAMRDDVPMGCQQRLLVQ